MDFLLPSLGLQDRIFLEFGSYGDGPAVTSSSHLYRAGTPTEYGATSPCLAIFEIRGNSYTLLVIFGVWDLDLPN